MHLEESLPVGEFDEEQNQSNHNDEVLSPSRDLKNKWEKDDLLLADFKGHKLIDYDYLDKKFVCIFQNFVIQLFDLESSMMTKEINLLEANGIEKAENEIALSVGLDKELCMLALASNEGIYLVDYQDEYSLINKIEVKDTLDVCFCSFNIVTFQKEGEKQFKISSYQFEDEPPSETGSYQLEGFDVLIKTFGDSVFFVCDNQIGRLSVPDMQLVFKVETLHTDTIIDFAFSQ